LKRYSRVYEKCNVLKLKLINPRKKSEAHGQNPSQMLSAVTIYMKNKDEHL